MCGDILAQIKLVDRYGNEIYGQFKRLDIKYIDKIIKLEEEIVQSLVDMNFYATTDRDEYIECIKRDAYILGVVTIYDELIAMGVYIKYGYSKHNYGYDLEIQGEELLNVGQIQSTVVKENYRGNGLQEIICSKLEEIAKSDNSRILSATVAPNNIYSLNNFKKLGYSVEKEKIKYGSYLRYILKKAL